ncbi:hypothetical protein DRP07_00770 [Archaeoglobales archaeon]|nr:MAG: hypothetical protein DRP07_00770 [Archaeoglobales archaeon]
MANSAAIVELRSMSEQNEQKKYNKYIRHDHFEFREQNIKITITRGQRGNYGWEITVVGDTLENVIALVKEADEKIRKHFLE